MGLELVQKLQLENEVMKLFQIDFVFRNIYVELKKILK